MKRFTIQVTDAESQEVLDEFDIEVENEHDLERLTHPLAAQEYAESIQSIVRDQWDNVEDCDD